MCAVIMRAALGAAALSVGATASAVLLDPPVNYDAVTAPGADRDVAAGDLDGDGDLDLAIAYNAFYAMAGIWLNDGNGGLSPLGTYLIGGAGSYAYGVALGDLDGDGDLDLAATVTEANRIAVLLNDGEASFAPHSFVDGPLEPVALAIGDMDGDGDEDIVAASFNYAIYVCRNDGGARFLPPVVHATDDGRPWSIELGDLDADGDLDVVTANDFGAAGLSVFRNRGDGTLAAAQNYAAGANPGSVTLGDLDGDGDLDTAVANTATYGGSPGVSVFTNTGRGRFADAVQYATGSQPMSVRAADIDGDGALDLAVSDNFGGIQMSNNLGLSRLSVLLNEGDGSLGSLQHADTGPEGAAAGGPWSLLAADLDGDGDIDLVTRNETGWPLQYTLSVLFNGACPPGAPDLFVSREGDDIVLTWIDACPRARTVLRSLDPSDFGGAVQFPAEGAAFHDLDAAGSGQDHFYLLR